MSKLESAIDPEALLVHADWVRRLARSLVRDPELAAEVERDSWLEALRRPARTVSLLRYLQGLPPREIAARLGRPLNTVRSQLRRGLEQLRVELDLEYGRQDMLEPAP